MVIKVKERVQHHAGVAELDLVKDIFYVTLLVGCIHWI